MGAVSEVHVSELPISCLPLAGAAVVKLTVSLSLLSRSASVGVPSLPLPATDAVLPKLEPDKTLSTMSTENVNETIAPAARLVPALADTVTVGLL
ncbi:MAG: hypothetical protein DHS20C11_19790 [Lysobacteraceae bacterium]|nr:MAG: hypothetical protein DHS20C11_19790 [Xanthomonadaceae bacterium]